MQDTLTAIYPKSLLPILAKLGRINDWLCISPFMSSTGHPCSNIHVRWEAFENKAGFEDVIKLIKPLTNQCFLCYLEAGGIAVGEGPKLFMPTEEQFDSMTHVDLHMPIDEFRSPYNALIIRIPNEWRKNKCREFGCDVERAPLHVMIRTGKNVDQKTHIFGILRYPESENYYQFQHNPELPERTLEEALSTHVSNGLDIGNPEYVAEVRYCRDAFRAALNLCMLLTYVGCKTTGPIDPRVHKKNRKEQDIRRFADFHGVQINQDIVVRKVENNPPHDLSPRAIMADSLQDMEDFIKTRLWEVKPHWRRGHWRRKPGWQQYLEAGQKPPITFVRPCLVRRDRLIDGPAGSNVTYKVQ